MKFESISIGLLALIALVGVQSYGYDFPKEILDVMPEYSGNYADKEAEIDDCYFDCRVVGRELQQSCYEKCSDKRGYGYVIPNEDTPASARCLYERLEAGTAFMSVGSERSFFGAALSKADRLLIVDMDIDICLFAYINRALLKISEDRADYVWLRLDASEQDWANRFKEKGLVFEGIHEIEAAQIVWKYWNNRVRHVKSDSKHNMETLSEAGGGLYELEVFESMHNGTAFVGANYLFQDELYKHLKELAINDRINIYNESILELGDNSKLVRDLKSQNICVGMIDISNVYSIPGYCAGLRVSSGYITTLQFAKFILDIEPYTSKNSWVVTIQMDQQHHDEKDQHVDLNLPVYNMAQIQGLLPKGDVAQMLELHAKERDAEFKLNAMCLLEDEEELVRKERDELQVIINNAFFNRTWAPECIADKESWPVFGSKN